jgi:hypothetical protein
MDPSTLLAISLAAVFAGAVAQAVTGMGSSLTVAVRTGYRPRTCRRIMRA